MNRAEKAAIQKFIDFLYGKFNGELTGPYVDWALAKTDFKTFAAGYLAEFMKEEE